MKMHAGPTSPFVRKVRVMIIECGLTDRVDQQPTTLTPINPAADLNRDNPLGKIPTLIGEAGAALFDSRVICEYLDTLHDRPKMFPAAGEARWVALRRQAQGDGMMDAAVLARYETVLRPEPLRWSDWAGGQMAKVRRSLDALESEAGRLGDGIDIGRISIGCALGYLDFRYPDEGWRESHPRLAAWYRDFAARDSMTSTVPPEG
ncbi:MAG: glutathione S-transferase [Alphaproteobacteria bacterium]|jgi:glutathione S-transferase|nr:glutathione S-transferase [Alphaproteobacteria bacterium]